MPSGFSVFACQKESLGKRCLITRDIFYEMKSCLQVDQEFFVDCFTLQDDTVLFAQNTIFKDTNSVNVLGQKNG